MSEKLSGIGAAVPGTPSMRAVPWYSGFPPGVCTVATTVCDELTMKMRTLVTGSQPRTRPLLDRKRRNAGEDVAAVLRVRHLGAIDPDLQEQVIDVDAGARRTRDDGDLARQRIGAADAVDLPGIRRSHDRQQDAIALRGIGGKIRREEVGTLRGAASHHRAGNGSLHGSVPATAGLKPPLYDTAYFFSTGGVP